MPDLYSRVSLEEQLMAFRPSPVVFARIRKESVGQLEFRGAVFVETRWRVLNNSHSDIMESHPSIVGCMASLYRILLEGRGQGSQPR